MTLAMGRTLGLTVVGILLATVLMTGCQTGAKGERPIYRIRVQEGDTLAKIAAKYDTTWQSIARLNGLSDPREIKAGIVLRVRPGPAGLVIGTAPKLPTNRLKNGSFSDFEEYDVDAEGNEVKTKPRKGLLFGTSVRDILWPLEGRVTSLYGMRWGRFHHGIDIGGKKGTKFHAAKSGRVVFVGWKRGYGKTIIVQHDDYKTLYAHASALLANRGDYVEAGQAIGRVGATGNARGYHLHFEVRQPDGKSIDPLKVLDTRTLVSSL